MKELIAFQLNAKTSRWLGIIVAAGFGIFISGLFFNPGRIWPNMLLASYYLLGLGLAGILFVALMYVSNAGWSTVFRRIPEALTSVLPIGALLMLLLIFGVTSLYEWSHDAVVQNDPILVHKSVFLNIPFFAIRIVLYFIVWIPMTFVIIRNSRKQDIDYDLKFTARNVRYSAIFIVAFGLTFWLASMDWIMSLEPHWFSTIFGIYNFAGLFLNGLAAITIIVIMLRRRGAFGNLITEDHIHDLGKLLFAFSTFWMYIWFSQYMLIWYSNLPEEVTYFIHRENSSWLTFSVLNVGFNWIIPFITLIAATAKKKEGLLLKVAIIIMIGHWIDLYWMILPPFMKDAPQFSIWEIGPIAAAVAGFFLMTFRTLAKHRLVPINDPFLVESIHVLE